MPRTFALLLLVSLAGCDSARQRTQANDSAADMGAAIANQAPAEQPPRTLPER